MFHSPKEIKETCMTYKDIKQSKMKKELILQRENDDIKEIKIFKK